MPFILTIATIHFAGILLLIVNSICLVYRRSGRHRCCKLKSDIACNILFIYHAILLILEIFLALLCQFKNGWMDFFPGRNLVDLFLILAIVNYMFLTLYLAPRLIKVHTFATNGYTRHCNATKPFAFLNFFVFWSNLVLLSTCIGIDCRSMPGFGMLADGYAIIPLVISYFGILFEAYLTTTVTTRHQDIESASVISKEKAIGIIQKRILEQPYIEGYVSCGHEVCLACGKYFLQNRH